MKNGVSEIWKSEKDTGRKIFPVSFFSKRFYLTVRENFHPSSKSSRFVSLLSKNILLVDVNEQRGLKMANYQLICKPPSR